MNIETYLGFDVGTKRTGIAIANSLTLQSNGLAVVSHHKNGATNWAEFDAIIKQHTVNLFIVGVPYDTNGKEQEMTFIAKSFARKLSARYNIDMVFVDEYLSSNEAKKQLKYNHHHKNASRGEVDKLSAALILQTWLGDS
ncbi:Holliday junction resolvase RuvX [Candidatus Thioglobus autotrophicus]|jgi:putative Holliday junction resolvase|uniref:Holliday junction resolvase RuvX n=1 Tax=Candidatus Thioglobus autotrophicus TaxID=1705394 RepID=UPI00299DB131|nr:Holliday junction resolvase RuvX [Candidatus Thioglobus autotrophicus]WPE16527.1 Holliday junction resolvase RuvX [Candidatus Thioglobus autotrophicus]WPE18073.1 Holliday junction resolvase RuvX [Candidatus Thioglobus autotrophicus]